MAWSEVPSSRRSLAPPASEHSSTRRLHSAFWSLPAYQGLRCWARRVSHWALSPRRWRVPQIAMAAFQAMRPSPLSRVFATVVARVYGAGFPPPGGTMR